MDSLYRVNSHDDPHDPSLWGALAREVCTAVVGCGIVGLALVALGPKLGGSALWIFLLLVLSNGWRGGRRAGLIATLVSSMTHVAILLGGVSERPIAYQNVVELAFFLVLGLATSCLCGSLPRLRSQAESATRVAFSVRQRLERETHARWKSEQRFGVLMNAGLVGIAYGDERGRILEANETFLALVQRTAEDVRAGRVTGSRLLGQDRLPLGSEADWSARGLERSSPHEQELEIRDPSGREVRLRARWVWTAEQPPGLVGVLLDVTRPNVAGRESAQHEAPVLGAGGVVRAREAATRREDLAQFILRALFYRPVWSRRVGQRRAAKGTRRGASTWRRFGV
jgi:PAS domain-containing protein